MILKIVPDLRTYVQEDEDFNIKVLDYKLFNMLEIHPFIATHQWERIDIILDSGIKQGYLRQVIGHIGKVRVIIKKSSLPLSLSLSLKLIEIFPDLASKIRAAIATHSDITEIFTEKDIVYVDY